LFDELRALKSYVQTVADVHPDAEAIIASSGLSVKRPSIRTKPLFQAVNGAVSGQVVLLAKWAGDRALYSWQFSDDGAAWAEAPQTLQARAALTGFARGRTYWFQMSVMTPGGAIELRQPVTLLVT